MGDDGCFSFGTPLEPYDEDEVPKKKSAFQDISEQKAYDSNGKRRFHGAFTGGFSAGHWNTVDTPEGWTPQTFKSSRSDRSGAGRSQRPEDFMDDEDRSEFGIAPRQVHTTQEFSGTKRDKQKSFHEGPIPGEPVLNKLLEPVHDTAAVKILKSMGWRQGCGTGEKVTMREKRAARKLYTCHIPPEFRPDIENAAQDSPAASASSDDEDLEEAFSQILFEPDDFKPYVARPKMDTFGLGYVGLSRRSILGPQTEQDKRERDWMGSHLVTNDKGKKVSIRGQAFGVGALEEEDEDIYAKEDLSNYDYALDDGKAKKKDIPLVSKISGRKILDGFISAKSEFKQSKSYPPPALPPNYVPNATRVRKSRFSDAVETPSKTPSIAPVIRDRGLGRHDLTAKDRSNMLGEPSIVNSSTEPSIVNKSEFIIDPKIAKNTDKTYEERIAAIVGRNINFTSTNEKDNISKDDKSADDTSIKVNNNEQNKTEDTLEKSSAMAQGFKPFDSNPAKQLRYEKFVSDKKVKKDSSTLEPELENDRVSNWEKMRELTEFEQAFRLYKPLTGAMSDRFTTAKSNEDHPVREKTKSDSYFPNESNATLEAARTGMFGKRTRQVIDFKPDPLLSKRFNVPEIGVPAPSSKDKKKLSYSIFEFLDTPVHSKNSFLKEQDKIKPVEREENNKITPPVWKPLARTLDIVPEQNKTEEILKPKEVIPTVLHTQTVKSYQLTTNRPTTSKRLTVAELFMQEKEKERQASFAANSVPKLQFTKELEEAIQEIDEDKKETIDNFNKIDLYKAIFLSDSESDSNENDEKEAGKNKERSVPINVTPKNVERNPSPPKGIFANLNFEKINSWRDKNPSTDMKSSIEKDMTGSNKDAKVTESTEKLDDNMYGPKLPGNLPVKTQPEIMEVDSSSDSSDWVETDKVDSVSSKKVKKSKKKKSKHKSKHKTKKKHKKSKD